jgi:hypothetical protein
LDYDEAKRPSTTPDEDFERYLFILNLSGRRLALQRRRRSHPALPPWNVVFERFVGYLRLLLSNAGLRPPTDVAVETEGETREEFIAAFNDANNRVILLGVADLDPSLLPGDFHFFNPRVDFNEVYGQGFPITAANTRRVEMEAKEGGDLRQSPDAKGYIQTANEPYVMKIVSKATNQERTLQGIKNLKLELTLEVTHDGQIQPESILAAASAMMAEQGRQIEGRNRRRRDSQRTAAGQTSFLDALGGEGATDEGT